jgi:hypothetical protein
MGIGKKGDELAKQLKADGEPTALQEKMNWNFGRMAAALEAQAENNNKLADNLFRVNGTLWTLCKILDKEGKFAK